MSSHSPAVRNDQRRAASPPKRGFIKSVFSGAINILFSRVAMKIPDFSLDEIKCSTPSFETESYTQSAPMIKFPEGIMTRY